MLSRWAYVLIGNNDTGKTTFQKYLIEHLCNQSYKKLNCNLLFDIIHPRMPQGVKTISVMSRSFQEKKSEYTSVNKFFKNDFEEADICILSSHIDTADIVCMIEKLRVMDHPYNVAAIFFSNCYGDAAKKVSELNWDERLYLKNEIIDPYDNDKVSNQIKRLAYEFGDFLIARASVQ